MAAHRRLGEEKVIRCFGEALQIRHPAEGAQMAKVDGKCPCFYHGENIKRLSLEMQGYVKKTPSPLPFLCNLGKGRGEGVSRNAWTFLESSAVVV